jgi:TolB-like protein
LSPQAVGSGGAHSLRGTYPQPGIFRSWFRPSQTSPTIHTDNLTVDLSRLRNSFVIARNTAFTYKRKSIDTSQIGRVLAVRYVLEGSVQRDGNRVRVNVQLIDADTGSHLWADRFEDELADLFKLQDQIVVRLANSLRVELVNAVASAFTPGAR